MRLNPRVFLGCASVGLRQPERLPAVPAEGISVAHQEHPCIDNENQYHLA
jgi:hypothetical protein